MSETAKPKVYRQSAAIGEDWASDYINDRVNDWPAAYVLGPLPPDLEAEATAVARRERCDLHSFLVGVGRIWRSNQRSYREDHPGLDEET